MKILSGVAIYFIIWWTTLFAVLPWGTTSAHETGAEVGPGHSPSAPLRPLMLRKVIVTTVIAAGIFAAFLWLKTSGYLSFMV
jgi:predicted secreted protein